MNSFNIIEALRNCEALHKNAPHAVLIRYLRIEVERFNEKHLLRLDPYREVDDYFRLRAKVA